MKILRETEKEIIAVAEREGYMSEKREWPVEAIKTGYAYYNKQYIMIVDGKKENVYVYTFLRNLTLEEQGRIDENLTTGILGVSDILEKGQRLNLKEMGLYYAKQVMCILRDGKVIIYAFEKPDLNNQNQITELLERLEK